MGVIPKPEKQVREGARSARLDFVNEDVATLEVKFVLTVNGGRGGGPAATTTASRTRVTIKRRLGSLARIENFVSGHSPKPKTETTSISTAGDEQQYSIMRKRPLCDRRLRTTPANASVMLSHIPVD